MLDYACGLGKWSIHLAQLGGRVSGFDLSGVAIEHARNRAEHNGLEIRFDEADAAALPYEDGEFDIALGVAALHHVIKYPGTADELLRVLRPGGLAVFTENFGHNPFLELGRRLSMRELEGAGDVILQGVRDPRVGVRLLAGRDRALLAPAHGQARLLAPVPAPLGAAHARRGAPQARAGAPPLLRRVRGRAQALARRRRARARRAAPRSPGRRRRPARDPARTSHG